VSGLQVWCCLPELDGAIDPVLGGLVGEDISNSRTGAAPDWAAETLIALRQTPPAQRRIAIVLYGFPGYGATGTAALLMCRALSNSFRH